MQELERRLFTWAANVPIARLGLAIKRLHSLIDAAVQPIDEDIDPWLIFHRRGHEVLAPVRRKAQHAPLLERGLAILIDLALRRADEMGALHAANEPSPFY